MYELIKKYTSVFSVSGREKYLADVIEADLRPFADEIKRDAMGNLIVFRKGADSSKKFMVAAHMDEIGFIVTAIDDKGFIRVSSVGGIYPLYSSYQTVKFESGIKGVIVTDSSVEKDWKVKDLVVDIGAKDRKDAEKRVAVGDLCAIVPAFTRLANRRISAKALDDRLGCAIAAKSAMNVKTPAYDTCYAFVVQEEVGLRGSGPAAFGVRPDYAVAIDVTATGDAAGAKQMEVALGKGAAIKLKDSSVICSQLLVDAMKQCAARRKIAHQLEVLEHGGTDTRSLQLAAGGCHAGCISIPTRYIHSPVEVVDMGDVEACEKLLTALIEEGIA